jgi:thioester reductase-like protein
LFLSLPLLPASPAASSTAQVIKCISLCLSLQEDYSYLTQHIDVTIHAAAQVNLIFPYDALVSANVRGTSHVLSFCQTGKMKALHYVSTDAVFPVGPVSGTPGAAQPRAWRESEELQGLSEELKGGYAQSKWVAEQIVRLSLNNGLPGCIYRCGNIGGDSHSSAWNAKDSNLAIMRACVLANAVPIVDGVPLHFEMTPADFVARFIVQCVEDIRSCSRRTFHLMQPEPLSFPKFLRAAQAAGYDSMRAVATVDEWIKLYEAAEAAEEGGSAVPVDRETLLEICGASNVYAQVEPPPAPPPRPARLATLRCTLRRRTPERTNALHEATGVFNEIFNEM